MAKPGLEGKSVGPLLAEVSGKNGWAICVGAGTSQPVFLSWEGLVESLVCQDVTAPEGPALAKTLLACYTPDALIQAACNRFALDEEAFVARLVELLYAPLRSRLSKLEWEIVGRVFDAKGPGTVALEIWRRFHLLRDREFAQTTASAIADLVARTFGTELAPTAVLSFNAEPLFYALLNDSFVQATIRPEQREAERGQLSQPIDLVTHSISDRRSGRVPYVFCHGRLPVPNAPVRARPLQSTDKLVYSESQYLQLAHTAFTWQASAFVDTCSARRVLFVGVSLSDANMRRWLSWLHSVRVQELEELRDYSGPSTPHVWMRKRPSTAAEACWTEAAVAHLGVRLVWLDHWSEAGDVMKRMLGIA